MSETIKVVEEGPAVPFALQFMEVIPQIEIQAVSGGYNDKLQVWEYGNGQLSEAFPVASFPSAERPATTSTVPTRLTPKVVRSDTGVDD